MSLVVVVMACAGREALTTATLDQLDGIGGASQLDARKVLYWTGLTCPVTPPLGWGLVHCRRAPQGHRRDLWRIMADVVGADDFVLFEDDIQPCVNAVPFIAQWPRPELATFHNIQRKRVGLAPVDPREGFQGTQAFKAPAALVARFVAAGSTDPARPHLQGNNIGGDTRITHLMIEWGEPIYTHRSLVQHVGAQSVHNPKATLTGHRAPVTDFDETLDALTLTDAIEPPWMLCDWPGGCLVAALDGGTRCDGHVIRRRRPRPVHVG